MLALACLKNGVANPNGCIQRKQPSELVYLSVSGLLPEFIYYFPLLLDLSVECGSG